jgi:hypothetical protein
MEESMRALTLNLFGHDGNWPARREALRSGLARLRPDVAALHVVVGGDHDGVVADLRGPDPGPR